MSNEDAVAALRELLEAGYYPGKKHGEVHVDGNFGGFDCTATLKKAPKLRAWLKSQGEAPKDARHGYKKKTPTPRAAIASKENDDVTR